jgi:hypothetical protein
MSQPTLDDASGKTRRTFLVDSSQANRTEDRRQRARIAESDAGHALCLLHSVLFAGLESVNIRISLVRDPRSTPEA